MARQVKMMMLDTCPYCRRAFAMMDELRTRHPEYNTVEIEIIEETREPQKTAGYDYYYVPAFFVDGAKVLEGLPTEANIEQVFLHALS